MRLGHEEADRPRPSVQKGPSPSLPPSLPPSCLCSLLRSTIALGDLELKTLHVIF